MGFCPSISGFEAKEEEGSNIGKPLGQSVEREINGNYGQITIPTLSVAPALHDADELAVSQLLAEESSILHQLFFTIDLWVLSRWVLRCSYCTHLVSIGHQKDHLRSVVRSIDCTVLLKYFNQTVLLQHLLFSCSQEMTTARVIQLYYTLKVDCIGHQPKSSRAEGAEDPLLL